MFKSQFVDNSVRYNIHTLEYLHGYFRPSSVMHLGNSSTEAKQREGLMNLSTTFGNIITSLNLPCSAKYASNYVASTYCPGRCSPISSLLLQTT